MGCSGRRAQPCTVGLEPADPENDLMVMVGIGVGTTN